MIPKALRNHFPVIILIGVLFILGIATFRDYGIPWDEKFQREIAEQNYNYVLNGDQSLLTFKDRYYGPIFEIASFAVLKGYSPSEYFYLRHLLVYATHLIGLLFFYFLANRLFRKSGWALMATIFLFISPRIFADSFYNAKDIPLMDAFIIATFTLLLLKDAVYSRKSYLVCFLITLVHSITTALALSTRIPGLLIVVLTAIIFIPALFIHFSNKKRIFFLSLIYLVVTLGFTMLFWPILWINPVQQIINAMNEMNSRPYFASNLFMGSMISGNNLPWHYLPVWIGITTPIIIVLGFIFAAIWMIKRLIDDVMRLPLLELIKKNWSRYMDWGIILCWSFLPILAVYLMHTVLYDGWRHVFFVYPAIVLIAVLGIRKFSRWIFLVTRSQALAKTIVILVVMLGILDPVYFAIQNHPFENVYFNVFAGKPDTLRFRYEMDYWGLSYKQALDYILATDPSPEIPIMIENSPGKSYIRYMLHPDTASRFKIVNTIGEANYFVTNFRGHPDDYDFPDKYFSINVRGSEIMVVYRLK
jgi:hypothetical protein